MDFFEKIGEKIVATGSEISDKAKEMSSVVALKNQIRTEENKIAEIYKRIGEKYFLAHKDDESDIYADDMTSIIVAQEGIKTLNQQIAEVKGVRICNSCGEEVTADSVFCPKCGAKKE